MKCRGLGLILCLIGVCELTGCASGPSRGLFVRNSRTATNKDRDRARAAQEPTDSKGQDADLEEDDETSRGRAEKDAKLSRAERDSPTKRPLLELPDDLPARAERTPKTPNGDSEKANNTLELVDGLTSIDHRIDKSEPSGGQFDVSSGGTRDNGFATIAAPAPKRRSGSAAVQDLPSAPDEFAVSPAARQFPTQSPLEALGQDTRVDWNARLAGDIPSNRLPVNRTSIDAVPTTDRSAVPAEFLSDAASSRVVPADGARSTTRSPPWRGDNGGSAFSRSIFDVDSANGLAPRSNTSGTQPSTWTELPGQRPGTNAPSSGAATPDPWPRLPAASTTAPAFANPATNVQLAGADQSNPIPGANPGLNFPTTTGQLRPSPPHVPELTNIPAGAPLAIAPLVTAPELERLITQITVESSLMTPGETEAERQAFLRKHVQLRLLHLIAGQMDRALQPVPGIDPADQEFWQQMLWGIANYFDTRGMPESAERATQTIAQLQAASLRLQEKARLELKNLAFCHKITSFGIYQRFKRDQFTPGQPVLLYAETANFKSEPSSDGQFRTLMKSTINIHEGGPQGRILESIPFKPSEDRCRNHRRDYFHSYEFAIPQGINPGPHVLRLTVEDQLGRKTASATMNFTVE